MKYLSCVCVGVTLSLRACFRVHMYYYEEKICTFNHQYEGDINRRLLEPTKEMRTRRMRVSEDAQKINTNILILIRMVIISYIVPK